MADKEKDVPIREQDDGSFLAKVEMPEEIEDDEKQEAKAEEKDEDSEDTESETEAEQDDAAEDEDESDEDREKIREARREERKLKKELARQRDLSAKHKIQALERRNTELAERLAKVENAAASYQFAQLDKSIEDEATRVEYAKMKMLQAAQSGDVAGQVEYLEQLTDAKERLKQAQYYKKQQVDEAKAPQARDTDSRIAKVIDQELAADGWDPADPEYWEELDSRLQSRLPHRYVAKDKAVKRSGPTASSRVANTSGAKPGTITLSRERVQAIRDAGAWDDVEKRNKMIRAYASYDRANKG
jgi:hypothetical protein